MKLSLPKTIYFSLSITVVCLLFMACEQPTATVSDLTKPLPTVTPTPTLSPTPPPVVDPRRTDLNRVLAGMVAPDFALEDMNKKVVHLSDFKGKKNVILVFYRGFF